MPKTTSVGSSTRRTTDMKIPVKNDGTKDQRYTAAQFCKADGTKDKRTTNTHNRK